jgi:ABC-type Zn uptake system ZnuABC Zn-binding protein ZnuA
VPRLTTVTRAEELAEKVRETLSYLRDDQENYANAALSELVADAEALAKALRQQADAIGDARRSYLAKRYEEGDEYLRVIEGELRRALARYRGEK